MSAVVTSELPQLNHALAEYQRVTGWTPFQVLHKQAPKLSFLLSQRLATLKPGKGVIRAERLAALASGEGVQVRESLISGYRRRLSDRKLVRGGGKRERLVRGNNTRRDMVTRELNLRERGRGYVSFAARLKGLSAFESVAGQLNAEHFGRYGQKLAAFGLTGDDRGATARFDFGSPRADIGEAMNKPAAQTQIALAIRELIADINVYIQYKLSTDFTAVCRAAGLRA